MTYDDSNETSPDLPLDSHYSSKSDIDIDINVNNLDKGLKDKN